MPRLSCGFPTGALCGTSPISSPWPGRTSGSTGPTCWRCWPGGCRPARCGPGTGARVSARMTTAPRPSSPREHRRGRRSDRRGRHPFGPAGLRGGPGRARVLRVVAYRGLVPRLMSPGRHDPDVDGRGQAFPGVPGPGRAAAELRGVRLSGPRSPEGRFSSMAASTSGSSGAVRGRNRAATVPSGRTRNFSKFHWMSPASPAASGVDGERLVDGVPPGPVHLDLLEHREGDAVGRRAELGDLVGRARLLAAELVAREADHGEPARGELLVQLLQRGVLRRQPALGRHVHHEQRRARRGGTERGVLPGKGLHRYVKYAHAAYGTGLQTEWPR